MNRERIIAIVAQARAGQATDEELQELADALDRDADGSVTSAMEESLQQGRQITLPGQEKADRMLADILETGRVLEGPGEEAEAPAVTVPLLKPWWKRHGRAAAAAAAILLLAGAAYFLLRQSPRPEEAPLAGTAPVAPATAGLPAGKKAMLTLANGTTVMLDEQHNDTITRQGNTSIVKKEDGRLAYQPGNAAVTGLALRNKVSTPRGGQYQVDLADGSRVWLNAASSLLFPVDFSGHERVVELDGEAYFEVAPDNSRPFMVKAGQTTVQVLGTHFSISAYSDETLQKTTLLEGKIKVLAGNAGYQLQPGQQVVFDKTSAGAKLVPQANMEEAVAWKNGYFQFSGADATVLLREISRWYNIEVVFNGIPAGYELSGKIDRSIRLSSIVAALREGGVHCTLEDNRLIVNK